MQYPAPGDPALAQRVQELLAPSMCSCRDDWGLDHGTWSVLCHVFPRADIPVVQLSIDETQPAAFHYELGAKLAPLRTKGVLMMGSGNLVHNLHAYAWGRHSCSRTTGACASRRPRGRCIVAGRSRPLVDYESLGEDALLSCRRPSTTCRSLRAGRERARASA